MRIAALLRRTPHRRRRAIEPSHALWLPLAGPSQPSRRRPRAGGLRGGQQRRATVRSRQLWQREWARRPARMLRLPRWQLLLCRRYLSDRVQRGHRAACSGTGLVRQVRRGHVPARTRRDGVRPVHGGLLLRGGCVFGPTVPVGPSSEWHHGWPQSLDDERGRLRDLPCRLVVLDGLADAQAVQPGHGAAAGRSEGVRRLHGGEKQRAKVFSKLKRYYFGTFVPACLI